jgi:transposase
MDVHTVNSVSRLEIVDRGGRRRFSDDAKLKIVAESYSLPRLGSATARKYGITRSQLADWRNAARAGRFGSTSVEGFVPAVIVPEVPAAPATPMTSATGSRMEIVASNGCRVIVDRGVDVDVLIRIMRGLETLR